MTSIIPEIVQKPIGESVKGRDKGKFIPQIDAIRVKGKRITEKIVKIFMISLILVESSDWLVFSKARIVSLLVSKAFDTLSYVPKISEK